MDSLRFFTRNPAFKLNGQTSISSKVAVLLSILILLVTLFICSKYVENLWLPALNLPMDYGVTNGQVQAIEGFKMGVKGDVSSGVVLVRGGIAVQPVSCDRKEVTLCYWIESNTFQTEVTYTLLGVDNSSTMTLYLFPLPCLSKTASPIPQLSLNPKESLRIQINKSLLTIDNSLFDFQSPDTCASLSSITHSTTTPPSTTTTPQTTITFVSGDKMDIYSFRREKLCEICGKLIACFNLLFLPLYWLLRTYHTTKYKCYASKDTINDPVLNHLRLSAFQLLQIWIYSSFPSKVQQWTASLFPPASVYVCLFILPCFERRLRVDTITSQLNDLRPRVNYEEKSVSRYFSYRLMLHNDLDDEEVDEKEYNMRIEKINTHFERGQTTKTLDVWNVLNFLNMCPIPVELEYHKEDSASEVKPSKESRLQLGGHHYTFRKDKMFKVLMVVVLGAGLGLLFLNDILNWLQAPRTTNITETILGRRAVGISGMGIVADGSVNLTVGVYSLFQLVRVVDSQCVNQLGQWACSLQASLFLQPNQAEYLNISIDLSPLTNCNITLSASQLIGDQIYKEPFAQAISTNQTLYAHLQLIDNKENSQSNPYLSRQETDTLRVVKNHRNRAEVIISLAEVVTVRKVTENNFYSTIRSSWTIIRLIVATLIVDLILVQLKRQDFSMQPLKGEGDNSDGDLMDIVALLNFRNTRISNYKAIHAMDENSQASQS